MEFLIEKTSWIKLFRNEFYVDSGLHLNSNCFRKFKIQKIFELSDISYSEISIKFSTFPTHKIFHFTAVQQRTWDILEGMMRRQRKANKQKKKWTKIIFVVISAVNSRSLMYSKIYVRFMWIFIHFFGSRCQMRPFIWDAEGEQNVRVLRMKTYEKVRK